MNHSDIRTFSRFNIILALAMGLLFAGAARADDVTISVTTAGGSVSMDGGTPGKEVCGRAYFAITRSSKDSRCPAPGTA